MRVRDMIYNMVLCMTRRENNINFMSTKHETVAARHTFIQARNTAFNLVGARNGDAVFLFKRKVTARVISMVVGIPNLAEFPSSLRASRLNFRDFRCINRGSFSANRIMN